MRIVFTDGEMSNLSADYGQLLCACACDYSSKPPYYTKLKTFTLGDYHGKRWNDKSLAKEWRDYLEDASIIVTWNGIKFDVPYLDTRLQRWGMKEAKIKRHKDLLYTARYKLRLSNNKLDTVAKFVGCKTSKTSIDPARWTMAMGGHLPSYRYIIDHCQRDIKVLAEVWEKLQDLVGEIK